MLRFGEALEVRPACLMLQWRCALQQRHGISTGLASSMGKKVTQTRSGKAARFDCVRHHDLGCVQEVELKGNNLKDNGVVILFLYCIKDTIMSACRRWT